MGRSLTIFAIPKPFAGHIDVIQRNAIQSWRKLQGVASVILCGDESGTAEVSAELGCTHIKEVQRTEFGTPLLDDVFRQVAAQTRDLMCYVNSDIILLSKFAAAVRSLGKRNFLMVGQRFDVDLTQPWDYSTPDWEPRLIEFAQSAGKPHPPSGSDYFVFPVRSELWQLPPFAVGRPGWDNWMIYEARRRKMAVVDASPDVLVLHQNHDYSHVPQATDAYYGPEADRNRELLGPASRIYTLDDASHRLKDGRLHRNLNVRQLRRHLELLRARFSAVS